jgi:hypothetical protein
MTNPIVGVMLDTPGDAVDVDLVQLENGPYATLPIVTTAAAATRTTESLTYSVGSLTGVVTAGCAAATLIPQDPGAGLDYHFALATDDASGWEIFSHTSGSTARAWDGTNQVLVTYTPTSGTANRFVTMWTGSTMTVQNQTAGTQTVGAFDGAMGVGAGVVSIGALTTGAYAASGVVLGVMLDPTPGRCLDHMVDWLGDSIILNCGAVCTPAQAPPAQLGGLIQRVTVNGGVGGNTTAQCAARWASTYRGGLASTLVWSCAVNDVASGISGATAAANAQAVVAEAVSLGRRVIVTGITPWAGAAAWSAGRGAEGDAYNALMAAWCPAHGCTYVSTDSLGTGSPLALLPAYDSGDHIHETPAGATALAALVQAAAP